MINHKIKGNPDCTLRDIGDKTAIKIIDVIQDEFWREWKRLMVYSDAQVIEIKYLGQFKVDNRPLRGHIRTLLRQIRKMRLHPEFGTKEEGMSYVMYTNKMRELKSCWSQLEEIRKIWIARTIVYNRKLRERGTPEKIKWDYEKNDYKFLK